MGECAQCGKRGLMLRVSKVDCTINEEKLALSPRTGGDGGVKVSACANSGRFCDACLPARPVAPVILSLFDEESFLGGAREDFQEWLRDPSKRARHVTLSRLCSPDCLRTLLAGRVRAKMVKGDAETRWQVKISQQSFTTSLGETIRYVGLFWYGEPGALAMPGGMLVRNALPTKEACMVFDELFGGPLAPAKAETHSIPDLLAEEEAAMEARDQERVATSSSAARAAEERGDFDEAIRLHNLARQPDEAKRVMLAKALSLAGRERFRAAAEVYDSLGMKAEAKVMRRRAFENEAAESGFGKEEAARVEERRPDEQKSGPESTAPATRKATWVVCPQCKKVLGRGFAAAACPSCGAALTST